MFRLRIITFFIVVLVAGGTFVGSKYYHVLFADTKLSESLPELEDKLDYGKQRIFALTQKSEFINPAILGIKSESSKIFQVDENEKPIHQKAIEYAQYQYCQQVIKEYETLSSTESGETKK